MSARLLTGLLSLAMWPSLAHAQQGLIRAGIPGCDFVTGNLQASCIPNFIGHIVQFIFMLIGTFFLVNIILAGYQITIASFEGSDRSKGYDRLKYSIIGFLVAALSFVIMEVVLTVLLG